MLIGEPGSRLKTCSECGMQWVEVYSGCFYPQTLLHKLRYKVELCAECSERYNGYVRRCIKRELWPTYLYEGGKTND